MPQPAMPVSLIGVSMIRPGNASGSPLNWPKMPAWAVKSSPRMKMVASRAISSWRASARAAAALRMRSVMVGLLTRTSRNQSGCSRSGSVSESVSIEKADHKTDSDTDTDSDPERYFAV